MKCKLCGAFPLDAEGEQRQAAYDAETARADRAGAEIIELGKDKQTLMTGMSVLKERAEKAEAACVELLELAKWCANADGHTWAVQVKAKGEAILAQPHPGSRFLELVSELQAWEKREVQRVSTFEKEGRDADAYKRTVILIHELLTKRGFESCMQSREQTPEETEAMLNRIPPKNRLLDLAQIVEGLPKY